MQRYLWMVVCLAWTQSMAASANPFDLDRNFRYVEKDQADLISELKVVAQKLEDVDNELDDIDEEGDEKGEEILPEKESKVSSVTPQTQISKEPEVTVVTIPSKNKKAAEKSVESGNADTTVKNEQKSGHTQTRTKKEGEKEISRPDIQSAEVVEGTKRLAEEKAKAEEARQKALTEQRKAEEKAQAQSQARKTTEKKEKAEKITAAKATAETASKEAVLIEELKQKRVTAETLQRQASAAKEEELKIRGMKVMGVVESDEYDINITKEQMEAAERAQEELLKAIAAVDRED